MKWCPAWHICVECGHWPRTCDMILNPRDHASYSWLHRIVLPNSLTTRLKMVYCVGKENDFSSCILVVREIVEQFEICEAHDADKRAHHSLLIQKNSRKVFSVRLQTLKNGDPLCWKPAHDRCARALAIARLCKTNRISTAVQIIWTDQNVFCSALLATG